MHDHRSRRRRGSRRGPFGCLHPLPDQRVDDRVELGAQAWIAEHDLAEALPVQRAIRAQHALAEGRGDLGQPGRAGYDYLPGGHVRVDEHRAVLSQPPGHLALARPDASGKPDSQQLQYLRSRLIRSPRMREINGDDSGFGVDLGAYSAPNPPQSLSPDLSRTCIMCARASRTHRRHSSARMHVGSMGRYACGQSSGTDAGGTRARHVNAAPTQWVSAAFTLLRLRALRLALAAGQLLAQGR